MGAPARDGQEGSVPTPHPSFRLCTESLRVGGGRGAHPPGPHLRNQSRAKVSHRHPLPPGSYRASAWAPVLVLPLSSCTSRQVPAVLPFPVCGTQVVLSLCPASWEPGNALEASGTRTGRWVLPSPSPSPRSRQCCEQHTPVLMCFPWRSWPQVSSEQCVTS